MESLELEKVLRILLFPDILRLYEFFCFCLSLGVTDLDIIALWLSISLVLLQTLVPVLDVARGALSEVVADDAVDRCLWSVGSSKGELLIRQRDSIATALEGTHSEWNSAIVTLSVLVILWSSCVSIYNCSIVEQLEISDIITILVVLGLVYFPGCADFRCSLLALLVRASISEVITWKSTSRRFRLADFILYDHVI